jgi:DNA-binding SARP family transcriptional activator/DNA-binding CsgD family transcriptional regulator
VTLGSEQARGPGAEVGTPGDLRLVVGAGLRVGVLGSLVATRDAAPLELGGPRQRGVLALLVLARGDVLPADRMIDALWGDATPPSATSALQAYVSHLRKRMEPDRGPRDRQSVIARLGPGYALRVHEDAVDSWRFERLLRQAGGTDPAGAQPLLEEALGLWRGPAYADHANEAWADAEVSRLTGLREVAREQLVEARLGQGESAVLVPEIEGLVADDPMREERWRLLVLALYRAHRQADALAALRRARSTLSDELGVDPGPALRALEAEVLAQSPSLDAPARPAAVAATGVPVPRAAQPEPPTLPPGEEIVDRDRELLALRGAFAEAMAGQGRLALIDGPAGIGKSRLLHEVRRVAAAEGALVLTARGSQLERAFGFGAVRQLFEGAVSDPGRRVELLRGAAASAGSVFDEVATPDPNDRADGSFAVLHGLYWLTVNLSEQQPLVLAVDDLQWCDTGSLRALAFLLRRLEGLPVLMVATLRTGEPHEDEGLIAEIAEDHATVRVHPEPLGAEATARLVRARLGDEAQPAFVAACHRTTGGNPLLLRQLLRALQVEGVRPDASHADTVTAIGSRAVSSMVLIRLGRLPQDCTVVARSVAVLGDGCELRDVAALGDLDETRTAAAVAALARAEVLRPDHPLGFVHPLVGDAVYQALPSVERELSHERAAALLHDRGAAPELVAAHVLLSPRRGDSTAVQVLRRAAATAADRGAADAATTYLERALAEPPSADDRPVILLELGRLATMTDGPAAVAHLRAAYDTVTDPAMRGEVATMLARTLVFAAGPGEATSFARTAAGELPADLDDARQGLHAIERIGGYMHGLPPERWQVGRPEVRGEGPGARMLAATLAWEELIDNGDRARSVALARFALADGQLQRVDPGLLWVVAAFVQEMGEVDMGDFWDRTLAAAFARGSLFSALAVHLWRGHMLWHRGQLREALHSVRTSNEQSELWGAPAVGVPYGQAFITGILLEQGDLAEARRYVDSVRHQARIGDGARLFDENYARLLAAEGRHAEALAGLEAATTMQAAVVNPVWRPWRTYRAPVLAALGRVDEARALMNDEVALARHWGAPSVLGRTLRVAGELGGDGAEAMLREAYTLLVPSVARYELACAELALARVDADPDERAALLRSALDRAAECGSPGLYGQVSAELVADGAVPPPAYEEVVSLTATERRIARLAADGASASAVAQALFLTPAVVERTLAEVRERLGVGSDAELGAALASV